MTSRPWTRILNRSILAVDDSPDDLFMLARLLLKAETDVRLQTAPGGPEAIRQLERMIEANEVPLVTFVDARMPSIDGFGLLQWIRLRSELRRMPVVMLADASAAPGATRAAALGAQAYLHKSITPLQLRAILDYAVECETRVTPLASIPCRGNLIPG